jgi:hypothetical protein
MLLVPRRTRRTSSTLKHLKDHADEVHLFVLVINSADKKASHSIKVTLECFRKTLDPDGTRGFLDHVALVFTHVPFGTMAFKDDDTFG